MLYYTLVSFLGVYEKLYMALLPGFGYKEGPGATGRCMGLCFCHFCTVALFLLLANFCQMSICEIWFRPVLRIFHGKKMTQIRQIWRWVPVCSHEYRRILFFFLLLYLVCSQIWQNYFVNDRHFGYIKNSLKETLDCNNTGKYPQTDSDRFGLHWLYLGTVSLNLLPGDRLVATRSPK